jgi:hypothetical protein
MDRREEELMLHLRWRIEARDEKLECREELQATSHLGGMRICKCNICRGQKRSLRTSYVVGDHLKQYGPAPFLRGSTKVRAHASILSFTMRWDFQSV